MRTILVALAILGACFMQEVGGRFLGATPKMEAKIELKTQEGEIDSQNDDEEEEEKEEEDDEQGDEQEGEIDSENDDEGEEEKEEEDDEQGDEQDLDVAREDMSEEAQEPLDQVENEFDEAGAQEAREAKVLMSSNLTANAANLRNRLVPGHTKAGPPSAPLEATCVAVNGFKLSLGELMPMNGYFHRMVDELSENQLQYFSKVTEDYGFTDTDPPQRCTSAVLPSGADCPNPHNSYGLGGPRAAPWISDTHILFKDEHTANGLPKWRIVDKSLKDQVLGSRDVTTCRIKFSDGVLGSVHVLNSGGLPVADAFDADTTATTAETLCDAGSQSCGMGEWKRRIGGAVYDDMAEAKTAVGYFGASCVNAPTTTPASSR